MRILSIVVVTLAGLGLTGCAAATAGNTGRYFGFVSGPLPQPQPFVVETRPAKPSSTYPTIGTVPPPRSDQVLPTDQRKALENSLLATPGRAKTPPKDEGKKAKKSAGKKSKAKPKPPPGTN